MKKIAALLTMLFLVTLVFAQKKEAGEPGESPPKRIFVTEVKVTPQGKERSVASVLLNDVVRIDDIIAQKKDGKTVLKFPVYASRGGKEYEQVKFLTKEAEQTVRDAIEKGATTPLERKAISYKITGWFKLRGQSSRKVNAEVTFNEAVAVSCGVMEGRRGPWIAWPAKRDEKQEKWVNQVSIENKEVRETVESALIEKYVRELRDKR